MSLAIAEQGDLIALSSAGDLYRININSGEVYWTSNAIESLQPDASDFFESSEVVINKNEIIFSGGLSTFSYDLQNGSINWSENIASVAIPIIIKDNIFLVTKNGYLAIIKKDTGKIIFANNIFKVLKKKYRETKVTGFIMGSGKIYSLTSNGFLIVSSATSGKVEYHKKIGHPVISFPIISNGKLFILTENSKIIGFN